MVNEDVHKRLRIALLNHQYESAAINIVRAADPEFGEEELPRGGKVETIVKDAVDRHGDTAYLGIICAMARIAIGELCESAEARDIEFDVNLDRIEYGHYCELNDILNCFSRPENSENDRKHDDDSA